MPGLGRIEWVNAVGSTSTALVDAVRAGQDWPDRSVFGADHQVAGRGRAGRVWTTPTGTALTLSVLLRPPVPAHRWGWLPLLAGVAVTRALVDLGVPAGVKWPNDVLIPAVPEVPGWGAFRKVAGVLVEAVDVDDPAVVLGLGVNVAQGVDELPVPNATSLALAGVEAGRGHVLQRVLHHLVALDEQWRAAGGDAHACGLAEQWAQLSVTPDQVTVDLPGGRVLHGMVEGLDHDGALLVVDDASGRVQPVHAGDVRVRARTV